MSRTISRSKYNLTFTLVEVVKIATYNIAGFVKDKILLKIILYKI